MKEPQRKPHRRNMLGLVPHPQSTWAFRPTQEEVILGSDSLSQGLGPPLAAIELILIPPNRNASCAQALLDGKHGCEIRARITQKYVGHSSSLALRLIPKSIQLSIFG